MTGALDGIRILDFTRILAGPFCTMLLGDLGAEVIKVEQPGRGDDTRQWGPPWVGSGDTRLSAYYLSLNRNKRSLTLNLKLPEGRAIARELARDSTVLIENFKVGQMRQYELDYDHLRPINPGLVYASITGYGQDGPYAPRPGYDFVIQGQSGLMSITGPAEGPPYKVGVAIADVITGLTTANAIQAALLHRERTGIGQVIDSALLDAQIMALVNVLSGYLVSDAPPARYGNAHPNIVPYEVLEAADGPFILAVGNDAQFQRLSTILDSPELAQDARFATNPARVAHRTELIALLQVRLVEQPAQTWIDRLLEAGVPAGPIHDIPAMLNDPQVRARGLVEAVELADGTLVNMLGPIMRLSQTPAVIRCAPPALGQDTDAILHDRLGLTADQIADYRARGVV